jgi:hypothetical protein
MTMLLRFLRANAFLGPTKRDIIIGRYLNIMFCNPKFICSTSLSSLKHNILSTLKSDTSTLSNARKCSMFPLNCYNERMGNKHMHKIIRVNKSIGDISSSTNQNQNKSYACKSTYVVCFYFD